jgi:hypothetical protein
MVPAAVRVLTGRDGCARTESRRTGEMLGLFDAAREKAMDTQGSQVTVLRI